MEIKRKAESGEALGKEPEDRFLRKIEEGSLSIDDMGECLTVFVQFANNTEDIQDEMGATLGLRVKIDGGPLC